MPLVLPYTLVAGTPENVNQLQSDLDAIVTQVNTDGTDITATNTLLQEMVYLGQAQEGVYGAGDLMVTFSSGMILAWAAGTALVTDDANTIGALVAAIKTAGSTVTIGTADATNPRIDQVVISKAGTVSVVAGTATSGATLANRAGAAALPASSCRLADVLVGAGVTVLSNSVIRDRRPWARGIYKSAVRTAGNITVTASQAFASVSSDLLFRLECSGGPVRMRITGMAVAGAGAVNFVLSPQVDATGLDGMPSVGAAIAYTGIHTMLIGAAAQHSFSVEYVTTPAAGSHTLGWAVTADGAATVRATAPPLQVEVEALVRQNYANNEVTSG